MSPMSSIERTLQEITPIASCDSPPLARNLLLPSVTTPLGEVWTEAQMTLGTLLLIVLILIFVGAIPTWPYSRSWGYAPSGTLGAVLLVLLIFVLLGKV